MDFGGGRKKILRKETDKDELYYTPFNCGDFVQPSSRPGKVEQKSFYVREH